MARKREEYAIGILFTDGTIRYVTEILPKHVAKWEDGKPAIYFPKETAKDICMGFGLNFTAAVPILKQDWIDLKNPEKETDSESETE